MAKLSRIANVIVQLRTTGIAQLSFSDALAMGVHNLSVERRMIITGADELIDAGLSQTDPLYRIAQAWFSQIPATRQLYIGRRAPSNVAFTIGTVAVGQTFTLTGQFLQAGNVTNLTATYTAIAGDDAADVATALAALLPTWPVTAAAVTDTLTVTPTSGVEMAVKFTGTGTATTVLGAPTETLTQALAASNGNWYGLLLGSRIRAEQEEAAQWVEANEKLFHTSTDEPAAKLSADTTSLMAWAFQNQMFRTAVRYAANAATQYPDAALMSNRFTFYPGAETWANVKLSGVAYDDLTEGESKAIADKNGNTFELFRNFAITQYGRVGGGEWIDIIRFRDWLAEEIRVRVVSALVNADGKVPFTDPGIAVIGNAITGALDLGVQRGGIAPPELDENDNLIPSYNLILPRSSSVAFNDKANRVLNDVKGSARLAGAIHVTNINISLSYAL